MTKIKFAMALGIAGTLLLACSSTDDATEESNGGDDAAAGGGDDAAAGGGDDAAAEGCKACDLTGRSDPVRRQCREQVETDDLLALCNQSEGAACLADGCPSEGLVGICRMNPGGDVGTKWHYYDADWTAQSAEEHCATLDRTPVDGPASEWQPN